MITATLPGQPFPRIDKRAADTVTYLVDCSPLLNKHELVVSAASSSTAGITISNIRTRKGTGVELRVANTPITNAAYVDFTVNLVLQTSMDNSRTTSFVVRVYK